MKITVTEEDIKNGVRGSDCNCPIALAIKRKTGNYNVSVATRINIVKGRRPLYKASYDHSQRSKRFMLRFDDNLQVEPTTFILKEIKLAYLEEY